MTSSCGLCVIYRQETNFYRRQQKFTMISPINLFCQKDTLEKVSRSIAFLRPENLRCRSKIAIKRFSIPDQVLKWVICACAEATGWCSFSLNYPKVGDHCHYAGKYICAAHSICNLKVYVPNEISVVFHNGLDCGYHFIVKELANEFEGEFECLGGKYRKVQNFFCSNRKWRYKNR